MVLLPQPGSFPVSPRLNDGRPQSLGKARLSQERAFQCPESVFWALTSRVRVESGGRKEAERTREAGSLSLDPLEIAGGTCRLPQWEQVRMPLDKPPFQEVQNSPWDCQRSESTPATSGKIEDSA